MYVLVSYFIQYTGLSYPLFPPLPTGFDIDTPDDFGRTCLHAAAAGGSELLLFLLSDLCVTCELKETDLGACLTNSKFLNVPLQESGLSQSSS